MYVNLIKYVQLMCISMFLNNINCEVFGIPNKDQPQLYQILECVVRCINNNNQNFVETVISVTESCYIDCAENVDNLQENKLKYTFKEQAHLELICRASYKLMLRVLKEDSNNSNTSTTLDTNNQKPIYMIKVQEGDQTYIDIYLSDSPIVVLLRLMPNTTYNLTAIIFNANGDIVSTPIQQMTTLHSKYKPDQIRNLSVKRIFKAASVVGVQVSWEPGFDKTCFYEITYWMNQSEPIKIQYQIDPPASIPYEYPLMNLKSESFYNVKIKALSTMYTTNKSDSFQVAFNTTRCNAFHNLNLTMCPPDKVTVLTAKLTKLDQTKDEFALNVTWSQPFLMPDNYTIRALEPVSNKCSKNASIAGNNTKFYTELVLKQPKKGILFTIYSSSPGGRSESYVKEIFPDIISEIFVKNYGTEIKHSIGNEVHSMKIWHILFLFMLAALLSLLFGLLIHKYRKNRKISNSTHETISQGGAHGLHLTDDNDKDIPYLIDEDLEISNDQIELLEKLGEGAFGMVKKGRLRYNGKIVAVKMLKENPTKCEIEEFRNEIELMKNVGKHRNIVGIVGYFTKDIKEMMLLTEYCGKGNLLNFLRKAWKELQEHPKSDSTDTNTGQCYFNKFYEELHELHEKPVVTVDRDEGFVENMRYKLLECDNALRCNSLHLLYFALQVAFGMEYLSNDKLVHRDLAARNVLVCDDLTLKIADFGLSRDVYLQNFYRKTTAGKLPIKWLALESITRQLYNVYTDVWSYGILLYEIFTLGNDPYPLIPANKILDALKAGYRLEKPNNCSDAVYKLMQSCWLKNPKQRPNFTEIKKILEGLIIETKTGTEEHVSFQYFECLELSETDKTLSFQSSSDMRSMDSSGTFSAETSSKNHTID